MAMHPADAKRARLALAKEAYKSGTIRLANPDLSGFSHIVGSRQGLFAINETRHSLVAHGLFFGLTIVASSIFAFEACDLARHRSARGRLVRLDVEGGRIVRSAILATGLDNGCHQIDFIDGNLCVLDTYNQEVRSFTVGGAEIARYQPLCSARAFEWSRGYVHFNSLLRVDGNILLMLHNGGDKTGAPSEIAVLDDKWRLVARHPIAGRGAHNLAVLEDGSVLCCGSLAGELIGFDRTALKVSDLMTRGLSVGKDSIVVCASVFSARDGRDLTPGSAHFLDRSFRQRAVLPLPAAPTDIRRLDGRDYSMSAITRKIRPRLP